MRQIVLDTETTGLEASSHRIIEIGCVELHGRRLSGNHYHHYLQPDRQIDAGAMSVHGISNEQLVGKPRFADIVDEFLDFVRDAELVIHNAPFDVGFLNAELARLERPPLESCCTVLDTLAMARRMHPGQRNNLDALCKRYGIDNSHRELHGALLDAEILAELYLAMTGGQVGLTLASEEPSAGAVPEAGEGGPMQVRSDRPRLAVIAADGAEREAHRQRLQAIDRASDGRCLWNVLN